MKVTIKRTTYLETLRSIYHLDLGIDSKHIYTDLARCFGKEEQASIEKLFITVVDELFGREPISHVNDFINMNVNIRQAVMTCDIQVSLEEAHEAGFFLTYKTFKDNEQVNIRVMPEECRTTINDSTDIFGLEVPNIDEGTKIRSILDLPDLYAKTFKK